MALIPIAGNRLFQANSVMTGRYFLFGRWLYISGGKICKAYYSD
jgi:hypothetical protein